MSKEESKTDSILEAIDKIESLIDRHSVNNQPYGETDINQILSGLQDVRKNLSELEGKYLKLAEEHDKIEYRVKTVEEKLGSINRQEELKHDRELKYIDYAVCSVIGSLVGYYISKLTGGN